MEPTTDCDHHDLAKYLASRVPMELFDLIWTGLEPTIELRLRELRKLPLSLLLPPNLRKVLEQCESCTQTFYSALHDRLMFKRDFCPLPIHLVDFAKNDTGDRKQGGKYNSIATHLDHCEICMNVVEQARAILEDAGLLR